MTKKEIAFREWVGRQMKRADSPDGWDYKAIRDAGAEQVGVSMSTAAAYLRKLTSAEGPYQAEPVVKDGVSTVRIKNKP